VAEAKNKTAEQELLTKDQEITSLSHRVSLLEAEVEKLESKLAEAKSAGEESEVHKSGYESLMRKNQSLEEELEASERKLKETLEQCVPTSTALQQPPVISRRLLILSSCSPAIHRLRLVDVKAEGIERKLTRTEQERDQWEQKYEVRPAAGLSHFPPMSYQQHGGLAHAGLLLLDGADPLSRTSSVLQEAMEKYAVSKRELDEVVAQMEVRPSSLTMSAVGNDK
jgi:tropomyosin